MKFKLYDEVSDAVIETIEATSYDDAVRQINASFGTVHHTKHLRHDNMIAVKFDPEKMKAAHQTSLRQPA